VAESIRVFGLCLLVRYRKHPNKMMSETKSKSVTDARKPNKVNISDTLAFVEGDVRRLEEAVGVLEKRALAAEELAQRCATEMREMRELMDRRDAEVRALVDALSVRPKPEEGKGRAGGRPKKVKKEQSYESYGWTGRDLCTLLDCALKGVDPASVAAFMSDKHLPKDLASFAKQEGTGVVLKQARDALEALRKSIELNFDHPEKGVKGFSSTVVRKANALFKLCNEAMVDTDTFQFLELSRLMKAACAAQKDVLTNGPPIESPKETTDASSLSLRKPVLERQVRVLPKRLRDVSPRPGVGSCPNPIHTSEDIIKETPEEEENSPKEEVEDPPEEETDFYTEPSIHSSHDDDGEDEENEESKEEVDEPEYEPSLETMDTTFEELVNDEWGTAWQKCREFPSLFGTITNARGMVTIFVRVEGNEEKDKKRVVAKVAHDAIAYSKIGKEVPLNEIE
jgi:hypothetical protein